MSSLIKLVKISNYLEKVNYFAFMQNMSVDEIYEAVTKESSSVYSKPAFQDILRNPLVVAAIYQFALNRGIDLQTLNSVKDDAISKPFCIFYRDFEITGFDELADLHLKDALIKESDLLKDYFSYINDQSFSTISSQYIDQIEQRLKNVKILDESKIKNITGNLTTYLQTLSKQLPDGLVHTGKPNGYSTRVEFLEYETVFETLDEETGKTKMKHSFILRVSAEQANTLGL